jgi:asparagine synthase (glutamine-hydrolysing)
MCGICGAAGPGAEREQRAVEAMVGALAHRGPDDRGVQPVRGAMLGNTRLAILDPTPAGHQPVGAPAAGVWITYNGEVYNYRELRAELERDGHVFRSGTDTEVVLALYLRDGLRCVERLRGMFAFAVWDEPRQRLFAARDHFGQKPFYYAERDGRLIFGSEIKALLAHGAITAEVEPAAIDYYLSLRVIPPPLTLFRGVQKLPAAHRLIWTPGGGAVTERYWQPRFGEGDGERYDEREWAGELRRHIVRAVDAHRVSDVPIGAFLSGGLDSSVVVAGLRELGHAPLQTFCVGSDHAAFDERPHARLMAAHAGTQHREVVVSADLESRIAVLVHALDEPSDPIAACFAEAARLAAGHVKVVLGGDGGDEIFAGFDRYAAFGAASRYAGLPRWLREGAIRPVLHALPETFAYKSLTQRARWLDSVAAERGGRLYARMTSHFRFRPEQRAGLYGPALAQPLAALDPLAAVADAFDAAPANNDLDRMIYADIETRLPEHTLMLADRLGMAYGLEVRSPLLDVELAGFCLAMPPSLRIRRGTTKYALRQAAAPWLPEPLLRRGKQGFMFPVAYWLDGQTLKRIGRRLESGPLVREGWIRSEAIATLLEEHARRRADHHVRIWQLASLDAWHRLYLDGLDVETVGQLTAGADAA